MKSKRFKILIRVLILLAAYAAFRPDVIAPAEAWVAPTPPPLTGALEPNTRLAQAKVVGQGRLRGPESIARDADGMLYTGLLDGRVVRVDPKTDAVKDFAQTGTSAQSCGELEWEKVCGRPLGLRFDAAGNLIVADAFLGLLSIDREGHKRVLTRAAENVPFGFVDDVDIAKDGRIYFSDASSKYDRPKYREDIVEGNGWGRLLRYDPAQNTTEVLVRDLRFANGVQLSEEEDYVLVVETGRYRIHRHWLAGAKAGTTEVFAENLPGMPDNVRRGSGGSYWVAMGAKRSAIIDWLHAWPYIKRVVARTIPLGTIEGLVVPKVGFVLQLDKDGQVVQSLWDESAKVISQVSQVSELDGVLYVGSIAADRIAVLAL